MDVIYRKRSPGKTREEMDALRARGERVDDFSLRLNPRTYEAAPGIICLQDECVTLRDGVKIYADIYLPKNAGSPFRFIVCWWFSGKRQSEGAEEWAFQGCPPDTVSKLAKFESADPAYWCRMGYAVANVDPRGVGNSGRDISSLPSGRKGRLRLYRVGARQDWCDGNVGMFGNSGVAMVICASQQSSRPTLSALLSGKGRAICTGVTGLRRHPPYFRYS